MCFWVLGGTISVRWFFWVPTTYVFLTNIKHVLRMLKGTVSLRRFFWVPTANVFGWESKWRKWLSNARFYLEVLFFAPYLGFRLSPKSLETSHYGGQGLFEPRLSHLFEFRNFVPLDRSKKRTLCKLITCNSKIESYQFFKFFIFIRVYFTYDLNV